MFQDLEARRYASLSFGGGLSETISTVAKKEENKVGKELRKVNLHWQTYIVSFRSGWMPLLKYFSHTVLA